MLTDCNKYFKNYQTYAWCNGRHTPKVGQASWTSPVWNPKCAVPTHKFHRHSGNIQVPYPNSPSSPTLPIPQGILVIHPLQPHLREFWSSCSRHQFLVNFNIILETKSSFIYILSFCFYIFNFTATTMSLNLL